MPLPQMMHTKQEREELDQSGDLLTIHEVAQQLCGDDTTVHCWIKSGMLDAVALPQLLLLSLLQAFLDTWVYANAYFTKDEVAITLLAFPLAPNKVSPLCPLWGSFPVVFDGDFLGQHDESDEWDISLDTRR